MSREKFMNRDIRLEMIYPHAPERVWRALTDSAAMADWLMPNDFAPRLGHRFQFRTKPAPGFSGIVDCEVTELMAPKALAFTWKGGGIDTVVRITLEAVPEGTRLRLEHTGFQGPRALMVSFIMSSGWKSKILSRRLPASIERLDDDGYRPFALDGLKGGCA
jgi:uncharacterized protein YndB with AHSA1/START domain